jgi:hypothetical protein
LAVKTEILSLRVPLGTTHRLRMLAHRRSLEQQKDIPWSSIIRAMIEEIIPSPDEQKRSEKT